MVMDTPTREGSWKTCRQEHNLYDVPEEENEPGQAAHGVLQEAGSDHWDLISTWATARVRSLKQTLENGDRSRRMSSAKEVCPSLTTRTSAELNWYIFTTGPFLSCLSAMRPLQLFAITQTNRPRKALQMEKNIHGPKSTFQTFSDTWDCLSFFASLRLNNIWDYWRKNTVFSIQFPSSVMPLDRYQVVSRNIHMSDPGESDENEGDTRLWPHVWTEAPHGRHQTSMPRLFPPWAEPFNWREDGGNEGSTQHEKVYTIKADQVGPQTLCFGRQQWWLHCKSQFACNVPW